MNSLISLEKVNYQIADQHILHDVDWQIPAGAHITLTGPSGGGKAQESHHGSARPAPPAPPLRSSYRAIEGEERSGG